MGAEGEEMAEPTGRRAKRPAAGAPHPGAMPPAVDHPSHAGHPTAPTHSGSGVRPAHNASGEHDLHAVHDSEVRAISVRTLGQGINFTAQLPPQAQHPAPAHAPQLPHPPAHPAQQGGANGSGRRRRLATPQGPGARQHPVGPAVPGAGQPGGANGGVNGGVNNERPGGPGSGAGAGNPAFHPSETQGHGQAFSIGAPAEGSEGPEMLDGPGGAVEITGGGASARGHVGGHHGGPGGPGGQHGGPGGRMDVGMDVGMEDAGPDEFTGPRRLLVWPEPDVSTRQALTDRGYRPVTVRSREEVDAQVAEYPAALFVDPLTGPITRTALQSLRAAAVAAEVPVLVTAGLGQATREAAYGADPAVLLKALAPRDSEQHPPRVLLVEGHQDIATAFTATLERRGMQVAHAASEGDAAGIAAQIRPNLVVMDLMLIRRRRVGIIDWLRSNGLLNRTPLVVYTSVDIEASELPRLSSGETVLFLAERSTSPEVQGRIVDLLTKIGTEL
jgi:CheY-like chemotaxis protein